MFRVTETLMSERFVVTAVEDFIRYSTTMEIWDRKTLELRHSQPIPYNSSLESINGQWVLLSACPSTGVVEKTCTVWDLESGTRCYGHIDVQESREWCIHKVDEKHAIVYTTTNKPDDAGIFEWALYQFSLDEPVKQLKKGRLQTNVEANLYWRIKPLDNLHVVYTNGDRDTWNENKQTIIHTIPYGQGSQQTTTLVKVPKEHVIGALLGLDYSIACDFKLHASNDIDHSKIIHWPNATKCQHVIGNLCIITERHDDYKIRHALVDISTGQLVRYLEPIDKYLHMFTMTAILSLNMEKTKVQVIDYGAL
jgi:hypothetical protein